MTDNEIVKALEGGILNAKSIDCKVWTIEVYKLENAIDLINRQQAEIEKVKPIHNSFERELECAKQEAIKEFAERLKETFPSNSHWVKPREKVDNLVQEMVGDIELNEYIDTLVQEMVDQQGKEDEGNEHI